MFWKIYQKMNIIMVVCMRLCVCVYGIWKMFTRSVSNWYALLEWQKHHRYSLALSLSVCMQCNLSTSMIMYYTTIVLDGVNWFRLPVMYTNQANERELCNMKLWHWTSKWIGLFSCKLGNRKTTEEKSNFWNEKKKNCSQFSRFWMCFNTENIVI